jgi:HAD superfamily hydrolase (TIGR01458 family)
MADETSIEGILFDMSGVLYVGSKVIDGAIATVDRIKRAGHAVRFITNTSTRSLQALHRGMLELGFTVEKEEILSAVQAAVIYLRQQPDPCCFLVLDRDAQQDFKEFRQSECSADYVIVGDIGTSWNYSLLNRIFRLILNGARLIAIHKNRFWQTDQGLQLDLGGFVAALEYACNQEAVIIGKPSADFFNMAIKDIDLPASRVAIVGDDIDSDVGGGQEAGLTGILVKTGKFRQTYVDRSSIQPDYTLDSVRDLPALLGIPPDAA